MAEDLVLDALIIGGDGQIGKALLAHLKTKSTNVVATTRRWPPYGRDLDEYYLPFDLRYPTYLPRAVVTYFCTGINGFKPCEADPVEAKRINTTLLVETAERVAHTNDSRIVYLSSCAVETHPDTVYATTKREAEEHMLPLGAAVYRFGPVAFPGRSVYPNKQYQPIEVPRLIEVIAERRPPGLYRILY